MGYLVSGLLVRRRPDEAALRSVLPESIAFSIYEHPGLGVFAVDGFRPAKPSNYPMSTIFPVVDLPLDLGPHLPELSAQYESAKEFGEANGIKRAYVNLAEAVSASLDAPVLAILADDNGVDFACIAEAGRAVAVWAQCGENRLKMSGQKTEWLPIDEPELHHNAAEAFRLFTGADPGRFGLGSLDPPDGYGLVAVGA